MTEYAEPSGGIARGYLAAHPGLDGRIIRREAAIDIAGQTFGRLLHSA